MTTQQKIKNREKLLQDITDGLKRHAFVKLGCLEVHLYSEDEECLLEAYVHTALDFIINDIYYDENSNWSEATSAKVVVV